MALNYLKLLMTDAARKAQTDYYGKASRITGEPVPDALTEDEVAFIRDRDSFYLGTVTADGWPYIQHRGGKAGFLRVLDPGTIAFADYSGNRQLISTGNIAGNDRVSLFLMDYPNRTRLKILGHTTIHDARQRPELAEQLSEPDERKFIERVYLIKVYSYDWNCPKYITPRFTAAEVEGAIGEMRDRITELEKQLAERG